MLVPAVELPDELWPRLLARESVCLVMDLDDDSVTAASVFTADSTHDTSDDVRAVMAAGKSIATIVGNRVITVLQPTPTLVIVGGGDIAEATGAIAHVVGWQVATAETEDDAAGLIAGLSELDAVVVLGHDLEMGGRALMTSLAGTVGYIGSVGSMKLQQSRSDWLAYRDVTDLARVHGPAGLDIGARSPQEVGVAIVAEIIAMRTVEPG